MESSVVIWLHPYFPTWELRGFHVISSGVLCEAVSVRYAFIEKSLTDRLVGYAMGKRMTTELITTALKKAYDNEQPDPGCIFHSDRGSQYCSHAFQDMLSEYFMRSSMSRRGQCWDNAPAESFWATLKREIMPTGKRFSSYELAKAKIEKWIMYYNGKRPHSKLGGVAPNTFYCKQLAMLWRSFKRESKVYNDRPLPNFIPHSNIKKRRWKPIVSFHFECLRMLLKEIR